MVQPPPRLPRPPTLDAIEAAETYLGEAMAWRVLVLRRGQVRADPHHFLTENMLGARWNPPTVPAVYTGIERETAGAEAAHLSGQQGPTIRFQLGLLKLNLERVADLSDPERLATVDLDRNEVENDDYAACRSVGNACSWLGMSGLLVPSARRWPETNLIIFPRNLTVHEVLEPGGEPEEWEDQ